VTSGPSPLARRVDGNGPRIVLVHGFTQTLQSWHASADLLTGGFEVVRMDLPGHGGSGRVRLPFEEAAAAVGAAGGQGVYVGYSMGGRLALRLALDSPHLVKALVLVSTSPGIDSPRERAGRRSEDEGLACELERRGTAAFLERWLRQPMFSTLTPTEVDLEARRANSAEGLATALRTLGVGAQEPLWHRLGELSMPVLLVAGELDAKYVLLAGRMAGSIGEHAQVLIMSKCGHAPHLEQPKLFCQMVWRFLHPKPSSARPASNAGSGEGRRTSIWSSTGNSGSATTSAARRFAVPRPHA
jgi:2-succinyl-6-hydroxy-2,4-cyclohexadiene-1-carboxylate synthase